MAEQPEKQIEKMLRDTAERRRREAGEGFALHPVNRRHLQDEVRRAYGRGVGSRISFAARVLQILPRLAWAGGAVAVLLALGIFMWGPRQDQLAMDRSEVQRERILKAWNEPEELRQSGMETSTLKAKQEQELFRRTAEDAEMRTELMGGKPASTIPLPASPPSSKAEATNPSGAVEGNAAAKDNYEPLSSMALQETPALELADAAAVAEPSMQAQKEQLGRELDQRKLAEARQPEPALAGRNGATLSYGLAPMTNTSVLTAGVPFQTPAADPGYFDFTNATTFALTGAVAGGAAGGGIAGFGGTRAPTRPEQVVLQNFRFKATDQQNIEIVDADGSVYTGRWEVVADEVRVRSRPSNLPVQSLEIKRAASAALPSEVEGSAVIPSYRFIVSGTNRTLEQQIIFRGVVGLQNTNVVNVPERNLPSRIHQLLPNSHVSGRAVLPGGSEIPVEARPIPPAR